MPLYPGSYDINLERNINYQSKEQKEKKAVIKNFIRTIKVNISLKGTVSGFSSDPRCNDSYAIFTTIP